MSPSSPYHLQWSSAVKASVPLLAWISTRFDAVNELLGLIGGSHVPAGASYLVCVLFCDVCWVLQVAPTVVQTQTSEDLKKLCIQAGLAYKHKVGGVCQWSSENQLQSPQRHSKA